MIGIPEALRSGSRLAEDYTCSRDAVRALYEYDIHWDSSLNARAKWLDESEATRVDRRKLVDYLSIYNRRLNDHPEVRQALEQLGVQGTLVVTGGQQSGLFTGPLFVIYKAASVIAAAREAAVKLGRPVVPVFWIAGEDHDWDEVNHTFLPNHNGDIVKLKLHGRFSGRDSVSSVHVDTNQWMNVIDQVEQLLPDTIHKPGLVTLLKEIHQSSSNLSDAFARLLSALFGETGLVLMDAADPDLRALEQPVFEKMIRQNDMLRRAYLQGASQVVEAGYDMSAEVAEDGANLFYIHQGARLLLTFKDGLFRDRKELVSFTEERLLQELAEHPERFSNNVLTRPLMQDSVLPVLSVILGNGEISYWGLTREAFRQFGLQMPILLPRLSFTIMEDVHHKHMQQYGVSFQDAQYRLEELKQQWLDSQETLAVDEQFAEAQQAIEEAYKPLLNQLADIHGGLGRIGDTNLKKISEQVQYMQQQTQRAIAEKHDVGLRHWNGLQASLFPMNKPQERVHNALFYLNMYGTEWIGRLIDSQTEFTGQHQVIRL